MPDNKQDSAHNGHKQVLPYGTWPSSLSAGDVAAQSRRLAEPQLCEGTLFWLEARPQEKGRVQVVTQTPSGEPRDLLPEDYSARSRVHEYGGGSYLATRQALFFVNNVDQRVYQLSFEEPHQQPLPLTPEGDQRYADLHLDAQRQRLLAVCEDHSSSSHELANYLVGIPLDASQQVQVLAEGADFYSNPRLAPDGSTLSWLTWQHPNMPWDASQLWLADVDQHGTLLNPRCVAGAGGDESLFQPQWSPEGRLFFVSDRTNWWNIYRLDLATGEPEAVTQLDAEFATPQWVFGMSCYGFLDENTLLATYTESGRWHLATVNVPSKQLTPVQSNLTQFAALHCDAGAGVLLAASPAQSSEVYLYHNSTLSAVTASPAPIAPDDVAQPQSIRFATSDNGYAHAFFYPPNNSRYTGPAGDKPPVITVCHGGPTGATETSLNLKIQYWTNRGFAVLDVNYRGSTGYGRHYRRQLYRHWGQRDVDDVCAAANYAVEQGWVHPQQRIIKGSSAGGYTVLAALTFRDTFNAGVSLYGVGDLELLARDTHKFESRYLDSLVGPYPEEQARYKALSPINHVERMRCPLLVFQGLEDKVVPPNQAEDIVQAVARQSIPVAYVTYPDEGHGFRQAENISHMFAAEHEFYQRIFRLGDAPAKSLINIQNLEAP